MLTPVAVEPRASADGAGRLRRRDSKRADIQVLRAVAALGVIGFHLWPTRLAGGYVGVDMFFVISGFLITGGILREASQTGRIRLVRFWGRRARRLLPAALLVIGATFAAMLLWVPMAFWRSWSLEGIASALYFQNWTLAAQSVDYWSNGAAASPFQHYWSLSVEEQFYLLWPILLLVAAIFAGPKGVLAAVGVLGAASFAYAALRSGPDVYFDTFARAWEFAVGALLVAAPPLRPRTFRIALSLGGWAAIALALLLLPANSGVPGPVALLPVLGTAAVIAAKMTPAPRGIVYLGDISYPLYLWHWPLLIVAPFVLGHDLGFSSRVAILAGTVILAAATHHLVERPFKARTKAAFAIIAVGMVAVLVAGTALGVTASQKAQADARELKSVLAHVGTAKADCFGAAYIVNKCSTPPADKVYPTVANLFGDMPNHEGCFENNRAAGTTKCTFGTGSIRVALIGNSHADLVLEGVVPHLAEYNWTVDTFLGLGGVNRWQDDPSVNKALRTGHYDFILVATNRATAEYYKSAATDARVPVLEKEFRTAQSYGIPVVALGDNPFVPQAARDCVNAQPDPRSCSFPRAEGYQYNDALRTAAKATGAHLITFDQVYCQKGVCPMVIGDVIVYRDENHLTVTFMRTLIPYIMDAAERAVGVGKFASASQAHSAG